MQIKLFIQIIARTALKGFSGWLIAKGIADESTAETVGAVLLGAGGVVWSWLTHAWFHNAGVVKTATLYQSAIKMIDPKDIGKPIQVGGVTHRALLLLALALPCVAISIGCQMTPVRAVYTAETTTQVTVEAAMTAWGDYVAQYHPPLDQERAVKNAYDAYRVAMTAAIDAGEVYAAAASTSGTNGAGARVQAELSRQAAANRLADLVALLRKFGAKL
jgi:hypothetical protein